MAAVGFKHLSANYSIPGFFILYAKSNLISSVGVLPSGGVMLYYILDTLLFFSSTVLTSQRTVPLDSEIRFITKIAKLTDRET